MRLPLVLLAALALLLALPAGAQPLPATLAWEHVGARAHRGPDSTSSTSGLAFIGDTLVASTGNEHGQLRYEPAAERWVRWRVRRPGLRQATGPLTVLALTVAEAATEPDADAGDLAAFATTAGVGGPALRCDTGRTARRDVGASAGAGTGRGAVRRHERSSATARRRWCARATAGRRGRRSSATRASTPTASPTPPPCRSRHRAGSPRAAPSSRPTPLGWRGRTGPCRRTARAAGGCPGRTCRASRSASSAWSPSRLARATAAKPGVFSQRGTTGGPTGAGSTPPTTAAEPGRNRVRTSCSGRLPLRGGST